MSFDTCDDTSRYVSSTHDRWRQAPVVAAEALTADRPILILAPHPDDESIGCGGLIRQAVRGGSPVFIDVLTDGSRSHPASVTHPSPVLAALRQQETLLACATLDVSPAHVAFWNEPDAALATDGARQQTLVARLQNRIRAVNPGAIFVTWIDDPHCDHKAAFRIATDAIRGLEVRPRLFAYPVWSWTIETTRHRHEGDVVRLDVASDLERKRAAIACHASQLGVIIKDDPGGFALTSAQLGLFTQPFETFIAVAL